MAPLDFMLGMATLKIALAEGQKEVFAKDLAGFNLEYIKIKIISDISEPAAVSEIYKVLILRSNDSIIAVRMDELFFYGERKNYIKEPSDVVFEVNEYHISQFGIIGEAIEAKVGPTTDKSLNLDMNFIFFKLGAKNFAIQVENVDEVVSSRLAVEYKVVSDQAIGYLNSKGKTIPIISVDGFDLRCQKIIVSEHNNLKFGFPVDTICHLVRDIAVQKNVNDASGGEHISYDNEDWCLFNVEAALNQIRLKDVNDGYQNIFSKANTAAQLQDSSVLNSLVLMDIGERVCFPVNIIRKVEAVSEEFDRTEITFSYNNLTIPLIDARKHYGFSSDRDKKTIERILVLEKQGVWVAVLVASVDAIVYVDQNSVITYGEWIFSQANSNFKKDVSSMIHVLNYQHSGKLNLINFSFQSVFEKGKLIA